MEEIREITSEQEVSTSGVSGYVKKYQLTEQEKKKVGISPISIVGKVLLYTFLIIFLVWTLFPLFIAVISSVIAQKDYQSGNRLFPVNKAKFDLISNYLFIFKGKEYLNGKIVIAGATRTSNQIKFLGTTKYYMRLPSAFLFTTVLVLPPTIMGLFTSAMSAFAFSKLNFKGKNWMFGLLLSTMMIPGALSLTPAYTIYNQILPSGTILMAFPLFIPGMFGAAAAVFFLKQYFTGIPTDLIEAGKLDGMGYYSMFFKIIIPLSGSALIAQGILGFVGGYNDYFGPMLYLTNANTFETIQLALQRISGQFSDIKNPYVFASCMVALMPTLALYFFAQRFFVEGIATSGMKI